MRHVWVVVLAGLVSACANGSMEYQAPDASAGSQSNIKIVKRPRDAVWGASIPELGKKFFVINNIDKNSGLINMSYGGDPEMYVDCGVIKSHVQGARGMNTYEFPAASSSQRYEVVRSGDIYPVIVLRSMRLEGRVNLIFESVDAKTTRITANTRYMVTESGSTRPNAAGAAVWSPYSYTVTFSTGSSGTFAGSDPAVTCVSTGRLEQDILDVIR